MNVTSLDFAGFVLLTLALYYLLPRRPQNILLLVVSYGFYSTWSWWYVLVLAAITLINFGVGLSLSARPRRWVLWLGIGVNLLALILLKYENFFLPDLRHTLNHWGVQTGVGGLSILLPVGMSFYVLAVISYLIDVYRGQMPACRDWVDFALYMAYFPKLLTGPIERARAFLPRLAAPRRVDNEVLASSTALILIGVVRKVVIANTMFEILPEDLWRDPGQFSSPRLLTYLIVYGFAIYNDFAGYTGIARGVSGLFGIELSPNFNVPYFARSVSEFWNRWHITLSHWLRDYIYFPTSRALLRHNPSRTNIPNILIPPLLTMLASGLWHGTGWGMLLWGALHGVYLILERLLALWRPAGPSPLQPRWRQRLAALVVFALVILAWVPFAAPNLTAAFDYWRGLLTNWGAADRPSIRILIILIPAIWLDWVQYHGDSEIVFLRWPRLAQAALLALAILLVFVMAQANAGVPFVYQDF